MPLSTEEAKCARELQKERLDSLKLEAPPSWLTEIDRERGVEIAVRRALPERPLLVLHVIPQSTLGDRFQSFCNFPEAEEDPDEKRLPGPFGKGYDTSYNWQGVMKHDSSGRVIQSYVQYFQNGLVESVDSRLFQQRGPDESFTANGDAVWKRLTVGLRASCDALCLAGTKGLAAVLVSVLNSSTAMVTGSGAMSSNEFGVDPLLLPLVTVEKLEERKIEILTRPFNSLWMASGWPCDPVANRLET